MFLLRSALIQDLSYCDKGRHAALAGCFPATGRLWLTVASRGFNVPQSSFQTADSSIRIILIISFLETKLELVSIFAIRRLCTERQYVPAN